MNYKHYENDLCEGAKDIKLSKFQATDNSDYDHRIMERCFSGRMTKARYKALRRICRSHSFSTHCHHEWDCCGCFCGQQLSFTYKKNQVVITLTQSFNY